MSSIFRTYSSFTLLEAEEIIAYRESNYDMYTDEFKKLKFPLRIDNKLLNFLRKYKPDTVLALPMEGVVWFGGFARNKQAAIGTIRR